MVDSEILERSAATSGFERTDLAQFWAGPGGRLARVVAGSTMIGVGLGGIRGIAGFAVSLVGLVPIAAGLFDFCLLSAALGGPFWGREIRSARRK